MKASELRQPLWSRQPRESPTGFVAFTTYRDMPERSLRKLARDLHVSATAVGRLSKAWLWQMRVEAWDRQLDMIRLAEREKVERERAEQWAKRREAMRDEDWKIAEILGKKITEMLQFPVAERRVLTVGEDQVTVLAPKFGYMQMARLIELERDLKLAAVGAEGGGLEEARRILGEIATRLQQSDEQRAEGERLLAQVFGEVQGEK